jgi:peptidoglycan/LPS O-acetylase OafA/YrhL
MNKLKYHHHLDGLRGIAVIMVMFFHFFQTQKSEYYILKLIKSMSVFGQTGVVLFFVLSGFLITRILINTRESKNYFKVFFARRSLRIFPLYYMFLFIYFYLVPFISYDFELENISFINLGDQLFYYCYLQNFAMTFDWFKQIGPPHLWSLAVEEHFYLFWPFIIYYLPVNKIYSFIFWLILITFIIRFVMIFYYGFQNPFYFTLTNLDSLVLGAFLAILEIKRFLIIKNLKLFIFILSVSSFVLVLLTVFNIGQIKYLFLNLTISIIYFSLIGIIVSSSERKTFLLSFLKSRGLIYIGSISYGLYVFHPSVFGIVDSIPYTENIFINFTLKMFLSVVISHLSFIFFESKFINLKKYFKYDF